MKRIGLAVLGCALGLSLSPAAQAQDLPAAIKSAGKVVIANQPNYPPMEYRDPATNTLKGLDIDLGTALAKELGVKAEWTDVGFEQMIPAVTTGRADLIHSGMTDLPKRRGALDFVDYMKSGAQFYILSARAKDIKTPTDLCGKTVGMSRRTSFPDEAKAWSATNCEGKGKPALVVVGTEGSADARAQLRQGRVDAAVQGSETLPYLLSQDPNTFTIVGTPFTEVLQGIGFAKSASGLRDAYAGALKKLMASGDYKKLFDSYGLGDAVLDQVMINGEPVKN